MLSSAVRTVTAACADDTLTRRSSVKRKIWSWARTAKSRTASSTGGVAMAWETASATIGRAADTKFEVRGEPQRRLVGDVVAHLLALRRDRDHVGEPVGVEHARAEPPPHGAERDQDNTEQCDETDAPSPPTRRASIGLGCLAPFVCGLFLPHRDDSCSLDQLRCVVAPIAGVSFTFWLTCPDRNMKGQSFSCRRGVN